MTTPLWALLLVGIGSPVLTSLAARMGLAELETLGTSSLMDEDGQALIDAALASIVKRDAEKYLGRGGDEEVHVTTASLLDPTQSPRSADG